MIFIYTIMFEGIVGTYDGILEISCIAENSGILEISFIPESSGVIETIGLCNVSEFKSGIKLLF